MSAIKRIILIVLAIIFPLSAISCSKTPQIPQTENIISAICDAEINLPAGKIYSSDFEEIDKYYLSDHLVAAYFGEPDIQKYKKDWLSYTVFLSRSDHICEFAAIYCATPESLIDTSRLLVSRLDAVKRNAPESLQHYTEQAKVITHGNYAILIISNDTKAAIKAIKKAI